MLKEFFLKQFFLIFLFVPTIGALLLFSTKKAKKLIYFVINFIVLVASILAINYTKTYHGNNYYYVFGNWNKAFGVEFKYDLLASIMLVMSGFVATMHSLVISRDNISNNLLAFCLVLVGSCNAIIMSNDIFNLYVFFELSSVATYIIYCHNATGVTLKANFDYLLLSSIVGLMMLFSIFLIYQTTYNLNIDIVKVHIGNLMHDKSINAAYIIILISMFLKIGLYPLHNTMFKIYTNVPAHIIALTSGISSKVYLVLIIKFMINVFGSHFIVNNIYFNIMIKFIAICGFIVLSFLASSTKKAVTFLTLSSFSQIAFIIFYLPFISLHVVFSGIIISIVNHSFSKASLFSILHISQKATGKYDITIEEFVGFLNEKRLYKFLVCLFAISIIGLPISLGFLSKFLLLNGLFAGGATIIEFILVTIGIIITIVCYLRIINLLTSSGNLTSSTNVKYNYPYIVILAIMVLILFLGIFSSHLFYN